MGGVVDIGGISSIEFSFDYRDSDLVLIRIYKLLDLLSRIIKISTANGGLFRFFKNDASFTIY